MSINKKILIRKVQKKDVNFLYDLENDIQLWQVSQTKQKFTKKEISDFVYNASFDIAITSQVRFIIDLDNKPIGCIDLYDYNFEKNQAGIGIVVIEDYRRNGYAKQALEQLIFYSWNKIFINKLYALIDSENIASIKLFLSLGFKPSIKNKYVLFK